MSLHLAQRLLCDVLNNGQAVILVQLRLHFEDVVRGSPKPQQITAPPSQLLNAPSPVESSLFHFA